MIFKKKKWFAPCIIVNESIPHQNLVNGLISFLIHFTPIGQLRTRNSQSLNAVRGTVKALDPRTLPSACERYFLTIS